MAIGQELSSIDFQSMIGGSLNAVIKAQAQSAQAQINKDNVQNLEVKWVFSTASLAHQSKIAQSVYMGSNQTHLSKD